MNSGYGKHLSFPFQIGTNGRTVEVTSLDNHIRDELLQLLLTNPGERAFLPEFGGGVRRLVFEPAGEATQGMTKSMITQAISTWLGHRIALEALSVEVEDATIEVELKYRIAGTEDTRVMRFQRKGEIG
jgi:phage baseplate assembly protein W